MSGISALFVGGPMNGRQEQLARPFPTHSFRMYLPNAHCVELLYVLDLKNFEPYVYVLKGLKGDALDQAHRDALSHARGEYDPLTARRIQPRGTRDLLAEWGAAQAAKSLD